MNRFLKVLTLLVAILFLLASGIDATLDHFSHSVSQSSYTYYDSQGEALIAYNGDLRLYRSYAKPGPVIAPTFIHRTNGDSSLDLNKSSSSSLL